MESISVPLPLLTDSYKISHFLMYPPARKMVAYGEFRKSFAGDSNDQRIVVYGVQYILEHYIAKKWTQSDLDRAELFFKHHNAGHTEFDFPKELFRKIVEENDGYFPVKIEVIPDGTVIYPHVPVYQITATDEYSRLVTYLETLLTMLWYPCTVATLSRRIWQRISDSFDRTVDPAHMGLLSSRLHDFGFRGCTSVEQSIIGGSAHLLNFEGTDTLSAAYFAQFSLNRGEPVGVSIPATEHSVMMAHPSERVAMMQLLEKFGSGTCACVMDSFDYCNALEKVLPSVASKKLEKGGFLVLRPDSGDPVESILQGLRGAEKCFGSVTNSKGYKVLNGVGLIQGDAVTYESLQRILEAVESAGYAANNVAFGMGAGLLQKVNRDMLSFATKLSLVVDENGNSRDVMKHPKTDGGKISLPGEFVVIRDPETGTPLVYPKDSKKFGCSNSENLLKCIYDRRPTLPLAPHKSGSQVKLSESFWLPFCQLKENVDKNWRALAKVPAVPVITDELASKVEAVKLRIKQSLVS